MGRAIAVLGTQWGDEGKGKIVDMLAPDAHCTVRFQGGHNAGHTLVIDGQRIALHLVPSGILHAGNRCLLGNGVVLAPDALFAEIAMLQQRGAPVAGRIGVSPACPLVMPWHVATDCAREARARRPIGTTGRGIGPAYEDKVARRALRAGDLLQPGHFAERFAEALDFHNFMLQNYYGAEALDGERLLDAALAWAGPLVPMLTDVSAELQQARRAGRNILFEGAQGALLDIDQGTWPFVTSSSTVAGGLCGGAGFGPLHLDAVVGVVKAYATRVGEGPFPTEQGAAAGRHLAQRGAERGTTTGRPRRCGWLDAHCLARTVASGGISSLCLTKLDVLDGLERIPLCVGHDGDRPLYDEMPGWASPCAGVRDWDELPPEARRYVERIEELAEVPVDMVSTGAERSHSIVRRHPFGQAHDKTMEHCR